MLLISFAPGLAQGASPMLDVRRREFITLLGGAAAAWPLAARAQQGERMPRIGVLIEYAKNDPQADARVAAFGEGLRKLGWTEGRNVHVDYRWTAGDLDRIRASSAELVALNPKVILCSGGLTTSILWQ